MKVKIFNAQHYESDIKKMEKEINDFLAEGNSEIVETYFKVNNSELFYFIEYEDED